jgi:diaminohydroxyphosphoribosylaminopyrimidine deaminase / 5-amino-6-(5-phosphoribosylamino)uracil reductase
LSGASIKTTDKDRSHMAAALALSQRHLGRTWPNPSVGCVLVNQGHIVGRGVTGVGGRPHGEANALEQAGPLAKGATAYVTLEPCAHHGQTRPCCDALIEGGVDRVVVAIGDPDQRTAGTGLARMREAGIDVVEGVLADEAEEVHAGFLSRVRRGRPLVTAKVAASLDGRVALASGESKWITGEGARRMGHALRASHDAILVGSGTAMTDNPSLTCRLPGLDAASPVRIVVDSALRLSPGSALVAGANNVPTWVVCGEHSDDQRRAALMDRGVDIISARRGAEGVLDSAAVLQELGDRGITRVLAEGGPRLVTSLLREGLIDRLAWFAAPVALGGDAMTAIADLSLRSLGEAGRWQVRSRSSWGADGLVMLAPTA